MDEIDAKLELIDEAYERVRPKLAARSTNDLLLEKAANMIRNGDYRLEVVRDTVPIYELGKAGPATYIEYSPPIYRISNRQEIIEVGEEINDIPEFQEILRRFKGG